MLDWLNVIQYGDIGAAPAPQTIVVALLLAFVVGQLVGWIYMATHTSPSYSASFVASLVVLPVIVALMMILMAGSLMIAFGMLAVFAVVRFRNVLKDTRDTTFILWAIVAGLGAGTYRYATTVIGAAAIAFVMVYLWWTQFGERHRFDAALSLLVPTDGGTTRTNVERVLYRYSDRTLLTGERQSPDARSVLSYRLLLRNPALREQMRNDLTAVGDVQELSFTVYVEENEI
jgi:hypothetical protein